MGFLFLLDYFRYKSFLKLFFPEDLLFIVFFNHLGCLLIKKTRLIHFWILILTQKRIYLNGFCLSMQEEDGQ